MEQEFPQNSEEDPYDEICDSRDQKSLRVRPLSVGKARGS